MKKNDNSDKTLSLGEINTKGMSKNYVCQTEILKEPFLCEIPSGF